MSGSRETRTEDAEIHPINHIIFAYIQFSYIMLHLYSIRQHLTVMGKKDGPISKVGVAIQLYRKR